MLNRMQRKLETMERERHEPIAIVGFGCRFPGGVIDAESYWRLMDEGRDAVSVVPRERWNVEAVYDPNPETRGKTYTRCGSFLHEHPERFDPQLFGISPREAEFIDPQHRLMLEVGYQALEHAGIPTGSLRDSATGVFVGIGPSDYEQLQKRGGLERLTAYTSMGTSACFAAGRLSYVLGLRGPALSVDTACSSSLVALHLACQSLRLRECNLALAGGVSLMLTPVGHVILSRTRALSPDGRCKAFSDEADGYGRGEGCGVLVLKRLSDALAAGDEIHALVAGSAVSHDGASSGLTVPHGLAQEAVIRTALEDASVKPADVDYVEAHGTGTPLGDPIELDALAAAYGEGRDPGAPLRVGTVKTNLGHLEMAAGIAGVIKVLLALRAERLPRHLHADTLTRHVDWDRFPLVVNREASPWPRGERPRLAGVSGFGFSGTNAHVIIAEAKARSTEADSGVERPAHVLPLSAHNDGALRARVEQLRDHLAAHPGEPLADVAHTLGARRAHHDRRVAFVAASAEALREPIDAWLRDGRDPRAAVGPASGAAKEPRVAMLFTGQGSQYVGMGRALYERHPVFREELRRCEELLAGDLEVPLLKVLYPDDPGASPLHDTRYTQPALFALSWSLHELWRSWGVQPVAVMGHSVGEIVAACAAGVLTLRDGLALVAARARLMGALPPGGGMASVRASAERVTSILREAGAAQVVIAAYNAPGEVVLSGPTSELEAARIRLREAGIEAKPLRVSHAFHSPLMEPMLAPFAEAIQGLGFASPQRLLVSNVTGRADATMASAAYWARHVREPVRFADGMKALLKHGVDAVIEVGPKPSLLALGRQVATEQDGPLLWLPSLREGRDDWQVLLQSLATLYAHGAEIDWSAFERPFAHKLVSLPSYPFERVRCWVEEVEPQALLRRAEDAGQYPLSGEALPLPGGHTHRVLRVGPRHQVYLADHVVHGRVVVPGAFHLAVLLAIAVDGLGAAQATLGQVQFLRPLIVDDAVDLHVVLVPDGGEGYRFEVATPDGDGGFRAHVTGTLSASASPPRSGPSIAALTAELTEGPSVEDLYARLAQIDIDWGPRWRWLSSIRAGSGRALTRIAPAGLDSPESVVHPTRLDNGFATVFAAMLSALDATERAPHLPYSMDALRWYAPAEGITFWHADLRTRDVAESNVVTSDLRLLDERGRVLVEIEGFTGKRAPRDAFLNLGEASRRAPLWLPSWHETTLQPSRSPLERWVVVASREPEARALGELLQQGGASADAVTFGADDLTARLASADAVVCLWDQSDDDAAAPAHALRALEQGLRVVQALVRSERPPRLSWVTRGAQARSAGVAVDPAQASLWGFGRCVMQEHPELGLRLIDVPAGVDARSALVEALGAQDDQPQLLRTAEGWYALRLIEAPPSEEVALRLEPEQTVLITGGLGALGSRVARWLVERHGARRLLLLSRHGAQSEEQRQRVEELRAAGAEVEVAAVDVSDAEALRRFWDQGAPHDLAAVIHAAGVVDDHVVLQQSPAHLQRVFAAKAAGAWNLHELTRSLPLRCFVLFSSTAALAGAPGQSNYAAANAFLDALAQHRAAQGLPAQSVSWGPWAGAGMAAALDEAAWRRMERVGVRSIDPADGVAWLGQAMAHPAPHLAIWPLNRRALAGARASLPAPLRALLPADRVAARSSAASEALLRRLREAEPALRRELLEAAVTEEAARVLGLASAREVAPDRPLQELGLDSLMAVEVRNALQALTGTSLSATLLFDFPTVGALSAELLGRLSLEPEPPRAAVPPVRAFAPASEPIAVVGMACRFPGGVTDPESYWELLDAGACVVREVPRDRWDIDALYDPDPGARGKMTTRYGGFLDDVYGFDASFFGIPSVEADSMDPQHRLLLETTWEAIERAGIPTASLMGSDAGVFVGLMSYDYQLLHAQEMTRFDGYLGTGNAASVASGRISYLLGLQGPSMTLDTACSSSLVATHLACQSLRSGECSLALASGVTLVLSPGMFVEFSRLRGLSPDGRCKAFDASADGVGWGEGVATLVLKRLSDALRDGNPVHAVIRGTAVTQDGRSQGLTAPNGPSQQAVIRRALAEAGVSPREIDYVEAHGTGTLLGDPIEAQALAAALGEGREALRPLLIGSVKSNLGHTQAAAGAAGLIKTVLALQHESIPESLHVSEPNPRVPWSELGLRIVTQSTPWKRHGAPRRAGVSSFGISGTNAHVVMEEAPLSAAPIRAEAPDRSHLVVLSARSEAGLRHQAAAWRRWIERNGDVSLRDVAYTSLCRRSHLEHRLSFVGSRVEQLAEALAAFERGEAHPALVHGEAKRGGKLAFAFAGMGSQWRSMGRELLDTEPVFAEALARCDEAIARHAGFSLLQVLRSEPDAPSLDRVDVVQPALFAMAVGLAAVWRALGLTPDAVIGHSNGEVAAAVVAGALSLDDGAQIVCERSALLARVPGGMAAVELDVEQVAARIKQDRRPLSVAASNSPRSTVVAGAPEALDDLLRALDAEGIFGRRVDATFPGHAAALDPLLPELRQRLSTIAPRRAALPFYSTVTAGVREGEGLDGDYWARNLREPVRFGETVSRLHADGVRRFIEVSAHPVLTSAVLETLQGEADVTAVGSLRRGRGERASLLQAVAALHVSGAALDGHRLHPDGGRVVDLPAKPFHPQHHALERAPAAAASRSRGRGEHPLLGAELSLSAHPSQRYWECVIDLAEQRFLADHRVGGAVVLPAAAMVEMALAAGTRALGEGPLTLANVRFSRALTLADDAPQQLQLALEDEGAGQHRFRISSRRWPSEASEPWTLHATGRVRRSIEGAPPAAHDVAGIRERCPDAEQGAAFYARAEDVGLRYGPAFQGITGVRLGDAEALAEIALPTHAGSDRLYAVHPALLDAGLQAAAAASLCRGSKALGMPVGIRELRVSGRAGSTSLSHATLRSETDGRLEADIFLLDERGAVLLAIEGLETRAIASVGAGTQDETLMTMAWRPAPRVAPSSAARAGRVVLVGGPDELAEALARQLTEAGQPAVRLPIDALDLEGMERGLAAGPVVGALYLGALSMPSWGEGAPLGEAAQACWSGALALVRALARLETRDPPRLWLATRAAQPVALPGGPDPSQATLWGFARTAALEQPSLRCSAVDLGDSSDERELAALSREILADDGEQQVALRGDQRYAARLTRGALAPDEAAPAPARDRPHELRAEAPFILERLVPRQMALPRAGAGEVVIAVTAAGLNFRDVLMALGALPGLEGAVTLGGECAGSILEVGEGVTHLRCGQEVFALTTGAFATHVVARAAEVIPLPGGLSSAQAAGISVVFTTAWYALHDIARLRRGERVLIHSATGGTGQAAIQVARRIGAEVLATAGSDEKRAWLRERGVEHVMDSRTLGFADQVLAATQGRGVDVVLNSLAGPAIEAGLRCLAEGGRFVELGTRDIYEERALSLSSFRKGLSFSAVDLAGMLHRGHPRVGELLREVADAFERRELSPVETQVAPLAQAATVFADMASARHRGKIVFSLGDPTTPIVASASPASPRADGTYLITGGLGGLGLSAARWLAERGAGHLLLVGRSGAQSDEQRAAVESLRQLGVEITIAAADVAERAEIERVLAQQVPEGRPLRGVIHTAGLLDDATLEHQDVDRFVKVMRPKAVGAQLLHVLTAEAPLDFFVLYSSAASLLGAPGQANYAGANAFLDALAHRRRAEGRPALSIDWGAFSGVGLAAGHAAALAHRGLGSLSADEGNEILGRLLAGSPPQVGAIKLRLRQWLSFHPAAASASWLRELTSAEGAPSGQGDTALLAALRDAPPARRRERLVAWIGEQVAAVLRRPSGGVDPSAPLNAQGLDSLMSIELRNRMETALKLTLSATLIWAHPTVERLAEHLVSLLAPPPDLAPLSDLAASQDAAVAAEVEALSNDEVARRLAEALED